MSTSSYDVIIVGSGIVGSSLALALQKNTSLRIAVIESQDTLPSWDKNKYDHRISAISPASQHFFETLGIWESIKKKRISPYEKMVVWDAESQGKIEFNCKDINQTALGYIIEDSAMRRALIEMDSQIDFLYSLKLLSLIQHDSHIELNTKDQIFHTPLLIGADGANSWVRDQADIALDKKDYTHTAIVATVQTEKSHQRTAWQRFLPTGPLAFLPLDQENHCSIVWSTSPLEAEKLMALDDKLFCDALRKAFDSRLGQIQKTEKRFSFPLYRRHVKNYVKSRIALVGDAAHTIHPLAGQGVNLGLQDVMCLSNLISSAIQKYNHVTPTILRRYERTRKSETIIMMTAIDTLKKLFESQNKSIQFIRNKGLDFTNRLLTVKNFIVNYAIGK